MSILKKFFGILLIVVGLVGIVAPVMPGWVLLFIGLEFFGIKLAFWEKLKSRFQKNKTPPTPPEENNNNVV